ncbi:deoxynucleoside kinase [Lachnoclostridium phytofermentans]|uniref:Deoxyadenosine kinase n=1 Tax=Lachnoclostridium phytofermentans (strain ATCC 700394 / DSM 18823 / ISDg) TaxID=357809 RepID=A9KKV8_LACP7|nr:deoxynucleoside kinase [Lachnoclostridium phytofermentans]ABX42690.1 Deoxyadenosine kinase [Lachnoclostridium phytofermentans ISDg]
MVIVVGGMIGLGKTSYATMLGEHFQTEVFYESVEGNKILPLFYTSSEEEIQKKRYPFLLQLWFLDTRFRSIKQAFTNQNNILDRSIYEDWYFAKKNMELGRISDLEMEIYEKLLHNMMEELKGLPKKSPDLMIYLKGSFETVIKRIQLRGREFEIDNSLMDYYRFLWEGYDDWVQNYYNASDILIIDTDHTDIVNKEEDRLRVIREVEEKLKRQRSNSNK